MADVPHRQVDDKFYAYPNNKIVGIIDTPDDLQGVLAALKDAGIDLGDIETLCGQPGMERLDRSGKRHGLVAQLIRLAQFMGEEQTHLQRHEEELAAGHFLISVVVGKDESVKGRVRDLLHAHGGHYVHYYGAYAVQDL
jgi:hypothetical protein